MCDRCGTCGTEDTEEIIVEIRSSLKAYINERASYLIIDGVTDPEWCNVESSRQAWERFEIAMQKLLDNAIMQGE